jgi:hypothetical protein
MRKRLGTKHAMATNGPPRLPAGRAAAAGRRRGCRSGAERDRRANMIRKLKSGEYRLYSRKKDAKTGKRKNLGTFKSREAAQDHERAVQYFKRH